MTPYLKKTIQILVLYLFFMALCRVTNGHALIGVILLGCYMAINNKRGWALFYFLMIPMLTVVSYQIVPRSSLSNIYCRFGTILMAFFLWFSSRASTGTRTVPLLGLFVYLLVTVVSSIQGVYPLISFLKLINFSAFIWGIYLGSKNLQNHPGDILLLRATFMAFSIFMVFGSLMTLPFPSIAYSTSVGYYLQIGDVAGAEAALQSGNVMSLFSGVTWHSQALAPMLAMVNAWLMCDMLIIERRFSKFHCFMLLLIPVLLYMTRSRAGFFSYVVGMAMIGFYLLPHSNVSARLRGHAKSVFLLLVVVVAIGAVIMEVRTKAISKWLRKSNAVEEDQRSFSEALTASRQGVFEEAVEDFKTSPLWGIGFQVERNMKERGWGLSLFSAPVEKGLLPMVVLGESGVVGFFVFVVFLFHFWASCSRRKYYIVFSLFVVLLATNIGEATFFSPSGAGGVLWIEAICGGFLLDTAVESEQTKSKRAFLSTINNKTS